MLIYCNGDSFTAGHGLGDDLIPTHPGYWNFIDSPNGPPPEMTDWVYGVGKGTRTQILQNMPGLEHKVRDHEKLEAWPNLLNGLIPDPHSTVVNASKQGSSLDSILTRMTIDLTRLQQSEIPVDAVIIQLTSFARMSYPAIEPNDNYIDKDLILSMSWPGVPRREREISEWYLRNCQNTELLIRALRNIALIDATAHSLTGKKPIFVDSSMFLNQFTLSIMSTDVVKKYAQLFNLQETLFESKMLRMEDIATPATLRCPCGHYAKELHVEFAQLIFDRYFASNK